MPQPNPVFMAEHVRGYVFFFTFTVFTRVTHNVYTFSR
jgi:hypothetical protein